MRGLTPWLLMGLLALGAGRAHADPSPEPEESLEEDADWGDEDEADWGDEDSGFDSSAFDGSSFLARPMDSALSDSMLL